jgi:hypothetical protein
MRRRLALSLIILVAAFLPVGCQRDRGVYAGNDTYQPRPAPVRKKPPTDDVQGELVRVVLSKKNFIVRVENGMEQTFKFDDGTVVMGLNESPTSVRNLIGKEGSELIVQWQEDEDGAKSASRVDVTQISTSKAVRHRR